jgi:hypothetical protein
MAVLTTNDRADCTADYIRTTAIALGLTKAQVRAAIDATDDWANSNATSFNQALPLPARTTLSAAQKARLLAWVITKRHLSGV